jgi:hypothetical protein
MPLYSVRITLNKRSHNWCMIHSYSTKKNRERNGYNITIGKQKPDFCKMYHLCSVEFLLLFLSISSLNNKSF